MISGAEIKAICHTTESEEKVKQTLSFVTSSSDFKKEKIRSFWDEAAVLIYAKFSKNETATILNKINAELSKTDKEILKNTFLSRFDDVADFHIRFSKQDAYLGKLLLSEVSDVIKLKIKTKNYPTNIEKSKEDIWGELFG